MAENITSPQIIRFCNEKIRVSADLWSSAYWTAKTLLSQAEAQGITALPATGSVIEDGAASDGRPPLSAELAQAILGVAQVVVHFVETPPLDPATGQPTGAPAPLTAIMAVAVNGSARF